MLADAKTKIVILDDDATFLEVASHYIQMQLGNKVIVSSFNLSSHFIEDIQHNCYLPESAQDILHSFYSAKRTQLTIEQTLKDLSELPAIWIFDYQLENEYKTGIDVCQEIQASIPALFRVLMTSHLDPIEALRLHNDGIIDLFVKKEELDAMQDLCLHLKKQISNIAAAFALNPEDIFGFDTVLEDESYINQRNVLLDEIGYKSFLTLSKNGDIAVLSSNDKISLYDYRNKAFNHHA